MGEGFDFPNLKIAAIHSPHKSLAVTLQFIGRFARTNAGNIDIAKFVAIPAEIQIESAKLYDQDAIWQEIIIDLSRTRIEEEVFVRETIENFHPRIPIDAELPDVSFYTLKPYGHVKVYKVTGTVDFSRSINLPDGFEVVNFWDYDELNVLVIIAKESNHPKWSENDTFLSTQFHLFVLYFDEESNLLFINSTIKQMEFYEDLAHSYCEGTPKILSLNKINKVLLALDNPSFYNVGMKNRLQSSNAESYRNITGPSAQKAISESDGQLYHRGHVFGGDSKSTIGFSSSSKIWSNARFLIPNLIRWCQKIAQHLTSNSEVVTHSPLDYLHVGTDVAKFPSGVIGALWADDVFKHPPRIMVRTHEGQREASLLDVNLDVDQHSSNDEAIRLVASIGASKIELDFRLDTERFFSPVDEEQLGGITVIRSHKNVALLEYFNANPPEFFFNDFSRLNGAELFPGPGGAVPGIREDQFFVFNWDENNVNIELEFGSCEDGRKTIHQCLSDELKKSCDIVFYDHGSGEIADFITFNQDTSEAIAAFYHCKGSSGDQPGARVKDYYEVCMQVVKSLKWIENNNRLLKHIEYRNRKTAARFEKGSVDELRAFFEETRYSKFIYKLVIVQPGISLEKVNELSVLLASISDYISKSRGQHLEIWCSK